jgi:2-keto-4-pentenoate hydratase
MRFQSRRHERQSAGDTRLDRPFSARLFTERLFRSGEHVPTASENLRVVEPEVAFVMRAALLGGASPYSLDEVLAAVESVHPALEIVSPRLPNGLAQPLPWLIADGGINDAFVLGPGVRPLSVAAYPTLEVEASRNGEALTQGVGANALGSPVEVLRWLANHLPALGLGLRAGDIVTTGLVTGIVACEWGDEVSADFAALGCVSVRF